MKYTLIETQNNYTVVSYENGKMAKAWNKGVPFEDGVYAQAGNMLQLPFVKQLCLMPDSHVGMGSTVGSVIAMKGAVVPSAVGVDIGCGMRAAKTNLRAEDTKGFEKAIFGLISKNVPHGRSDNGGDRDIGRWRSVPKKVLDTWRTELVDEYKEICETVNINRGNKVTYEHLGTLGTGNHFMEVCSDTDGVVWLMVHSGSRGVGARTGGHFARRAKEMIKEVSEMWHMKSMLPDPDLAYLPQGVDEYDQYLKAVKWCQLFAFHNRRIMMDNMIDSLATAVDEAFDIELNFDCHHNYIDWENHRGVNMLVTRKGAIRAKDGDLGIIPGSMGQKSYIVEGKGNEESLTSCSHGAGRKMSRGQAKREISLEDHIKDTNGVVCDKTAGVIDESPQAYKSIDNVIAAESDLVDVKYTLKQFVCVKGTDTSANWKNKKK